MDLLANNAPKIIQHLESTLPGRKVRQVYELAQKREGSEDTAMLRLMGTPRFSLAGVWGELWISGKQSVYSEKISRKKAPTRVSGPDP